MDSETPTRLTSFNALSETQRDKLQSEKFLELSFESTRKTEVKLLPEKSLLTVITKFGGSVQKTGGMLRALNEANKNTTAGAFIYTENSGEDIAIRTTTFYPVVEGMLPEPQILDIVKSHYTSQIDDLVSRVKPSG